MTLMYGLYSYVLFLSFPSLNIKIEMPVNIQSSLLDRMINIHNTSQVAKLFNFQMKIIKYKVVCVSIFIFMFYLSISFGKSRCVTDFDHKTTIWNIKKKNHERIVISNLKLYKISQIYRVVTSDRINLSEITT